MNSDLLPPGPPGIEQGPRAGAGARPRRTAKRRRGGQKGNQNARKHGFYSGALDPAEICEFWSLISSEGLAPEMALLRIRLRAALQQDPGNRRVLNDASRTLAKWYSSRSGWGRANRSFLRRLARGVLIGLAQQNESNVP